MCEHENVSQLTNLGEIARRTNRLRAKGHGFDAQFLWVIFVLILGNALRDKSLNESCCFPATLTRLEQKVANRLISM